MGAADNTSCELRTSWNHLLPTNLLPRHGCRDVVLRKHCKGVEVKGHDLVNLISNVWGLGRVHTHTHTPKRWI